MLKDTFIGLIQNIALLVMLVVLYDTTLSVRFKSGTRYVKILMGFFIGSISIAVMVNSWKFLPGVVFDTRSILLSVTGLYFGITPTFIAVIIASLFRIYMGGGGVYMGVVTIVTSAGLGLAWAQFRDKVTIEKRWQEHYLFGVVVHFNMLLWTILLPREVAFTVFKSISLPVIILFPAGTVFLGMLIELQRERRETASVLEKNEIMVRRAQAAAHIGSWEFDLDKNIVGASEEARRIYGMDEKQFTIDAIQKAPLSEYREQLDETLKGLINGQCEYDIEFRIRQLSSGKLIDIHSIAEYDSERNVVYGTIQDITDRKIAEEALRLSVERWSSTFDAISDIICVLSKDHIFLEINRKGLEVTGLPKEEILGRKCYEIIHTSDKPIPDCPCVHSLIENRSAYSEYEENGFYYNLSAWPIYGQNNTIEAFVHIIKDVTDQKKTDEQKEKLETQLKQAQKMESIGRLAGGVAHDFNNMLGVILGNTEIALETIDPSHTVYNDLQEIRKAANRSADLTHQLLAFARKQTIIPVVLDLNAAVESMLKMIQRLIGENIDLVWKPGEDIWNIKMDSGQIHQILANLCVNSKDAIEGVGKITIETKTVVINDDKELFFSGKENGEFVQLIISDTGCGIDKEHLDHLFEPFFTTKDMGEGTGLGLATVYGIVKQNNGFITVYSEPDRGSAFNIYLPRYAGEIEETVSADSLISLPNGHETVLFVEDEPSILKLGKTLLEKLGYEVLSTISPVEAVRLADNHKDDIHLLITDVIMPDMNGRDMADRISSMYPNLKCLFISGYTADIIAHHGVLDEGVHFIQKPFSNRDFAEKIRETLDSR